MNRLTRVLAVRPGEGRAVVLVAGAFAIVDAGRGLGEVGVDTLVLTRFGAQILPALFVGLGLVGLVVTLGYGAALTRFGGGQFFAGLLALLAAVLAVEWLLALSGVAAIIPLVWVSVYVAGSLLLTAMWTVGSLTFDARQARRLFPLLTSAAVVGSLLGFLSAIGLQRLLGAESLVAVEALLLLIASAILWELGDRVRHRRPSPDAPTGVTGALTMGASYVAASPLMRLVALAYVLLAVLLFSLTFPFLTAMRAAFPDESELLPVLAVISAAVTVVSFLAGTLLANRLFVRFGIATVTLALPLVYLAGFGLWLVRFGTTAAIVVRVAQQVTQRGVANAAWGALFNVVPSRLRGQVLAFMDGVPGQAGTMLSGVLLILAGSLALDQVFVLGLLTALMCLWVGVLIRRTYASSLVATLREGQAEQVLEGGPGLRAMAGDPLVVAELRGETRSTDPRRRLLAVDLLTRLDATMATADLQRLCADDDPGVRRAAIQGLARLDAAGAGAWARAATADADPAVRVAAVAALAATDGRGGLDVPLVEALRMDADPAVRAELAVSFGRCGQLEEAGSLVRSMLSADEPAERAAGLTALARVPAVLEAPDIRSCLDDPDPLVRTAAIRAWAARNEDVADVCIAALDDPSRDVRLAAAAILHDRPGASVPLERVIRQGPERAREPALLALAGQARSRSVRETLLAWADDQVARATTLRSHRVALAGAEATANSVFLDQVIARRERAIESSLLQALSVLGAGDASGLIRRCLHAADPEVRAQAIEALDTLGDPRLVRGVVRLLDEGTDGPGKETRDAAAATAELAEDRDPWVRALALRTMTELLPSQRDAIARRAGSDPDPVVRSALGDEEEGALMPGRLQLVNQIERMMVLRRVPLFAALDPEDLQRVVSLAAEQSWAADDVLLEEGSLGDGLIVIVEGVVRVVRGQGADTRLLGRYGEGDHIGELAVLRAAPRAATVIADTPVRGLVISGSAVQALLMERPEAAMAMLATLAERISQQA